MDEKGNYGNPVGIVIDEQAKISKNQRQKICINSGFSEVVFINNIRNCNISIFSPTREIEFAGHAVIGTVSFLDKLNNIKVDSIECLGHKMLVRHEDSIIWVKADLKTMPDWNFKEFGSAGEVNKLDLSQASKFKHCYVWSWQDKKNHTIRARTFASDWLIPEDEANGSGSMLLSKMQKCNLKIKHGKGSVIYANYINSNYAEVGGLVVEKHSINI